MRQSFSDVLVGMHSYISVNFMFIEDRCNTFFVYLLSSRSSGRTTALSLFSSSYSSITSFAGITPRAIVPYLRIWSPYVSSSLLFMTADNFYATVDLLRRGGSTGVTNLFRLFKVESRLTKAVALFGSIVLSSPLIIDNPTELIGLSIAD